MTQRVQITKGHEPTLCASEFDPCSFAEAWKTFHSGPRMNFPEYRIGARKQRAGNRPSSFLLGKGIAATGSSVPTDTTDPLWIWHLVGGTLPAEDRTV